MEAGDVTGQQAVDSDLAVVGIVGDLSVVTTADSVIEPSSTDDDGGDVARDPDAIAHEIEQTRAELAHTIDAIADRISPKKAAARGVQAVKSHVPSSTPTPAASDAAGPAAPTSHAKTGQNVVVPIGAIAAVAVIVLLFVRKRRRR